MVIGLRHGQEVYYYMMTMKESGQKQCMGDEEDGCGFFASQIREIEVIVSQNMRARQGKNVKEGKGNVVINQHNFGRKYRRGRQDYGHWRNGRHEQRQHRIMWKEKEEPQQQRLQVKRNNAREKNDDLRHQKGITAKQAQTKQKLPTKIVEKQIHAPCQKGQKDYENSRDKSDKSMMHLSNESNQKSTDTLNMAYIECAQLIPSPIDEDLTAFIEKQFGQSHQRTQKQQNKPPNDDGLMMEQSFNIESVNIDLNPKKMSKKQKKVPKGKNQKIILQKKNQNSLSIIIGQSILAHNDASINKSSVQSQKSIIMTTAISKQLRKLTMQTYQKSPYRKIEAQIFTNGCVGQFKVQSILVKPFERVIEGIYSDEIVKSDPNENMQRFASRQYYDHQTKISLCQMKVPQLLLNIQKNDEYYEILGGLLLRIDSFRLKCSNCSGKMYITIGKHTNEGVQSCQKCSMPLKIVVNFITVGEQE